LSINDLAHKNNEADKTKKFNIDTIKLMFLSPDEADKFKKIIEELNKKTETKTPKIEEK